MRFAKADSLTAVLDRSCVFAVALLLTTACPGDDAAPAADGSGTTGADTSPPPDDTAGSSGPATTTDPDGTTSGSAETTGAVGLPCNGHVELCDRPYDLVVFPGTHNSHAAMDDGYPVVNANHVRGIGPQLVDGVRAMLIDIYPDPDDDTAILMCHGPCSLASTPHIEGLQTIVDFLVANPREVLTIIYQDGVGIDRIEAEFAATGADALVYAHEPGTPWPTLGEMIEADTRLVVTAESGGPPPAWFHHVWDEAWDTPYGPSSIEGLSCDLNRGDPEHDLFLVNHWVNTGLGLPSQDNASEANTTEVLLARAQQCWAQWDHPPNFLVVDFYEQGSLFSVVDTLNGVDHK